MEIAFEALGILLSPQHLLLLVAAVVAGLTVGAVPGMTSTMAIGLLVPLTFATSKYVAFILLLGIYCGAIYGGAITAILMNLPGTPTAAITAIEGYPMTRKGEGGKAIGIATLSSTLGGLVSCVFLIFLSLPLANIAILFGPTEYFALGTFALAVVMALSGRSVLKGLVSTALGVLFATVGIDMIAQSPRFTFGVTELLIGIPAVPAIIGLFCVSEAFRMAENVTVTGAVQKTAGGFRTAYKMLPKLWVTISKSSLIGTFIGVLPGIGALMASYLSYAEAKRVSKTPEQFGKGAPEGVCASESANNAVTGGALVPMLALGIPGDTNTLMILGAMIVHGLVPGPTLFREEPSLVYVIFGAVVLSNLLILPLGLSLARHIAKFALIDRKYLMPTVAVLAITGASIGYGHIYYFWISIIFGLIGYLLQKGDFPLLPIAMALILEPLIERNFRSSLMLPDAGLEMFLSRPITLICIVMAVLVIWFGIRRERRLAADVEIVRS
ncbi:MAG: tripartite tricarboxylate transporter permease [Hyphomicrobiaceae bacterium]|nr:tripartite tricarboxylate transporter permease [Hyphomicrobiaceae bacterium]